AAPRTIQGDREPDPGTEVRGLCNIFLGGRLRKWKRGCKSLPGLRLGLGRFRAISHDRLTAYESFSTWLGDHLFLVTSANCCPGPGIQNPSPSREPPKRASSTPIASVVSRLARPLRSWPSSIPLLRSFPRVARDMATGSVIVQLRRVESQPTE